MIQHVSKAGILQYISCNTVVIEIPLIDLKNLTCMYTYTVHEHLVCKLLHAI